MNDLKNKYKDHYTVGQLLDYIEKNKIPRDAKILSQRIEDFYFEKNKWEAIKKEGENWHSANEWNKDVDSGKYLDKEQYPLMKEENLVKIPEENMENAKTQYSIVWCPVQYPNDENLYLDIHY